MTDVTLGVDVSDHHRPIDWQQVAAAGYRAGYEVAIPASAMRVALRRKRPRSEEG